MNYAGLKDDVMTMLSGERFMSIPKPSKMTFTVSSKDEALTALIHLGYLGYDREEESAYIPNYEVKKAYHGIFYGTGVLQHCAGNAGRERLCGFCVYSESQCRTQTGNGRGVKAQQICRFCNCAD